jgi:hypothetical protein
VKYLECVIGIALLAALCGATSEPTPTAQEVMQRTQDRNDGKTFSSDLEMRLVDGSGVERRRRMRFFAKDHGEDEQRVLFLEEPADVRNTGFLIYDRKAAQAQDDQWLYLPAFKKTKRIASTDQSGSFLGSDLSYADFSKPNVADYDYRFVAEEAEFEGRAVWQIEAVPKTPEEEERTGYARAVLSVRKDNDVVVRAEYQLTGGKTTKVLEVKELLEIDGVWVATRSQVTSRRGETTVQTTYLAQSDVRVDRELSDELFTTRRLEKGL